jgi:hypothetical protein
VPALELLRGLRVVADPGALDAARWKPSRAATRGAGSASAVTVLRLAPDDAFAIGATSASVDDEHAIIEDERGFVGGWCALDAVRPHLEWSPPTERPALTQGSIAGVPAKLWLPDDGEVLVVTAAAYADVLAERLGWPR